MNKKEKMIDWIISNSCFSKTEANEIIELYSGLKLIDLSSDEPINNDGLSY